MLCYFALFLLVLILFRTNQGDERPCLNKTACRTRKMEIGSTQGNCKLDYSTCSLGISPPVIGLVGSFFVRCQTHRNETWFLYLFVEGVFLSDQRLQ